MRLQKRYFVLFFVIALVFVLIWQLSSSFAYMDQGYEGNNIVSGRNWGVNIVEISNIEKKGDVELKNDRIDSIERALNFYVRLTKPGDSLSFDVKVTNTGKLNAELYAIARSGVSQEAGEVINYESYPLDYVNTHTEEHDGSIIKPGESHMFRVTVSYSNNVSQKPDGKYEEYDLSLGQYIIYKQR
ncbi:MAG: hypothetical protein J6X02_00695 [Bacilli bacterium]|nr:hypothetical protein [Bacilli bacterium]